jgi:hypothetical protein
MTARVGTVRSQDLTPECWGVQLWGLGHCNECEFKDTGECGGKEIRKTGMNEKGVSVPIGEIREV